MEDTNIVAESAVITGGGVNITGTGTLNVASGSLNIAAGSLKVAGGNVSLASGVTEIVASGASISLANGALLTMASGGSLTVAAGATPVFPSIAIGAPGTASVSVATASGTTVPVAQGIVRVSNTAASTSGSCTLAAGTVDGQQLVVVNEAAAGFVVTGNMKANQTVAASSGALFVWVSADTLWWRCN